ncbi:MAG: hypothetical protein KC503_11675 [Myxococcales bacterium]|nr:hypothetical protein [Myxococcales bacterium]
MLVAAPREMSKTLEKLDGFTRLEHDFFNSEPVDELDEEVLSIRERFRANLAEFMTRFRSEKAIG